MPKYFGAYVDLIPSLKLSANAPENRQTPKRKVISQTTIFQEQSESFRGGYTLYPFWGLFSPQISLNASPSAKLQPLCFLLQSESAAVEDQALTKAEIWSSSGATWFGDTFFGFHKQDFPNRRHNLSVYIAKRKHPKMTSELNRTSSSLEKLGVRVKH